MITNFIAQRAIYIKAIEVTLAIALAILINLPFAIRDIHAANQACVNHKPTFMVNGSALPN
jgi:hypothetical protein